MANDIERKFPEDQAAIDIVRDNPYNTAPPPPVQNQTTNNQQAQLQMPPVPQALSTPLSTTDYAKSQVQSAEQRKALVQQSAQTETTGLSAQVEVQRMGAAEQARSIEESRLAMQQAIKDANIRDDLLRKQIRDASARQIDPDHWWASRTTGQKILAGVGMILGGFGAGMAKRGENPAQTVINNAINQDIEAQKESIAENWKGILETKGLNDTSFNREMHRQAWENNYRVAGLEKVKLELGAAATQTKSEMVKTNALTAIQDLSDQQMKIRNQQYLLGQQAILAHQAQLRALSKEADTDVQALIKEKGVDYDAAMRAVYSRPQFRDLIGAGLAPREVIAEVTGEVSPETQALQAKAEKRIQFMMSSGLSRNEALANVIKDPAFQGLLKKSVGTVVPDTEVQLKVQERGQQQVKDERERAVIYNGVRALAPTKETAEAFRKDLDHIAHANALLQEIIDFRTKHGGATWDATDTANLKAKRNSVINEINELSGVNRLNEKEIELVQSALPEDPNAARLIPGVTGPDVDAQLENAKQILNTKINGSFKGLVQSSGGTTAAGPSTSGADVGFVAKK